MATNETTEHARAGPLALLAAVCALTFAAFSPTLAHWFVRDDFVWLREASSGFSLRSYGYLRPVSNAFFWVEHQLFGLEAQPYYWMRLALHAWNAMWLAALVGRVYRMPLAGALAALLFVPLSGSAASVHWISGLVTLLAPACGLPALYAHVGWLRGGGRARAWLAATGVLLAVGSKESGSAWALLYVALELRERGLRGFWRRDLAYRYAPLALVAVLYLSQQGDLMGPATIGLRDQTPLSAAGTFVEAIGGEVPRFSVPYDVTTRRPRDLALGISILLGLLAAAALGRGWRGLRAALGLLVALLLLCTPLLNFLVGASQLAGRYAYLPVLGLAALAGVALAPLADPRAPRWRAARVALLLALLVVCVLHVRQARRSPVVDPRFGLQSASARSYTEQAREELVPELASWDTDQLRFALAGAPFENVNQIASHGATFLGLDPGGWSQLRINPSDPVPRALSVHPARWLRANHEMRALYAYDVEHGLSLHSAEDPAAGEALWPLLTYDWRKPNRQQSPVMLFLYSGPPPQLEADS